MKVHEALSAVMADVQAVGKNDVNKQQGWSFRGVDAVVNAVGPALRKHGVTVVPRLLSSERRDVVVKTKNGEATGHECLVEVEYRILGPEGDELTGTCIGESIDYGDKGTAQAMSVAYRTWWLQLLCIPTDDKEPDQTIVERAGPDPAVVAAQKTLLAEVKTKLPELDQKGAEKKAREVWDAHGQDPKRLNDMIGAV